MWVDHDGRQTVDSHYFTDSSSLFNDAVLLLIIIHQTGGGGGGKVLLESNGSEMNCLKYYIDLPCTDTLVSTNLVFINPLILMNRGIKSTPVKFGKVRLSPYNK